MKTEYSVWICNVEKDLGELCNNLDQNYVAGYELVTSYPKADGKIIIFIFKKTNK